jgi:hypothetical protein
MPFTTLAFNDFDPVTGPPTVDGLTAISDAGVITSEVEPGYVQGGRLAYAGGSGLPPVVVDGVRTGQAVQLGLFCRFDLSFEDGDTIVVAVKPTPGSAADTARRIDIHPVYLGVGVDNQSPTGGPAGDPDDSPPGMPPGAQYHIRTNKPPARLDHWRGTGGTPRWTTENPDGSTYDPPGVHIRARSWTPPVPTLTTTTGAQTLPSATVNVLNTQQFPSAGLFRVGGSIVSYTGKTSTSFTGCTGGSGAVPAGTAVSIPETAWSAELLLPLRIAESGDEGADGINLSPDGFGLFIDVIRAGVTPASGGPGPGGVFAAQYLFPTTAAALTGTLGENLNIPTFGTGLVPALQSPPGSNTGIGVRILNGELGIGARLASAQPFSPIGSGIDRNNDNHLVTQVENTDPANPATGVTSEVRIANWGLPPAEFPAWQRAPGAAPNPSNPQTVTSGTPVELIVPWASANIPAEYATRKHQCMFVQLTADSGVNFVSSSERRNMDFIPLSEEERPADVSGEGYPAPGAGQHDFLLVTNTRLVSLPGGGDGDGDGPDIDLRAAVRHRRVSAVFVWIVHGYRITGDSLTIRGRKYEILDPAPGQFGFIAEHDDLEHALTSDFSGAGIRRDGNVYRLRVPRDGTVTIRTRVEAAEPKPPSKRPGGCLEAIIRFIERLRGK